MMAHRRVGERTLYGVKHGHDDDLLRVWYEGRTEWWPRGECLPDLGDPSTVGCLLAMVREAWGGGPTDLCWMPQPKLMQWWVTVPHPSGKGRRCAGMGPTEVAALVAALKAAPAREVRR